MCILTAAATLSGTLLADGYAARTTAELDVRSTYHRGGPLTLSLGGPPFVVVVGDAAIVLPARGVFKICALRGRVDVIDEEGVGVISFVEATYTLSRDDEGDWRASRVP